MKRVISWLLVASLSVGAAWAQQNSPQSSTPPNNQAEQPEQKPAPEKKISPAEAEALFRSVDEILKFASDHTGLPIKHKVKSKLTTRDEVEKYITDRMKDDEDTRRLQRSEAVLKKFGLVPREFDLKSYLLKLYREQVAGFYDTKTKTMYLLDWVDLEQQKAILAHELTHALQDQNFNIEKWMKKTAPVPKSLGSDVAEIEKDEERTSKQGVIEGQAMGVLVDYSLAPMNRSMTDSPGVVEALGSSMLHAQDSPVFSAAPLFLREALTFPYRYGLSFTQQVLSAKGKAAAYMGVLERPPLETQQLMHPDIYLKDGPRTNLLAMPKFEKLFGKEYEYFDEGAIGEFDANVLLQQYASAQVAARVAPGWNGAYYYAVRKKGATEPSLIYVSRWKNADFATEFARAYAKGLEKRYKTVKPVYGKGAAVSIAPTKWDTEYGPVHIDRVGSVLVITEGVDDALAENLKREALNVLGIQ